MLDNYSDIKEITQKDRLWDTAELAHFVQTIVRDDREQETQTAFGQFFTPYSVAELMSSMLTYQGPTIHILDAGAGIGNLFASAVAHFCQKENPPDHIMVTAYEIDDSLIDHIYQTFYGCKKICEKYNIKFTGIVKHEDFIEGGIALSNQTRNLFSSEEEPIRFHCAIINPPYKKINNAWREKQALKKIGIDASNLYVGFVALAARLLVPSGELVAITPRSFCNGPYFKKFRKDFLQHMVIQRLHVFDSRSHTFEDDNILQENIILHAMKTRKKVEQIIVTTSPGSRDEQISENLVRYDQVIQPDDPQSFIRIMQDADSNHIAQIMSQFQCSLNDIEVNISTGKVVDFRALEFLRKAPETNTVPLLYPSHLQHGRIHWPLPNSKKPNAIVNTTQTQSLLVPNDRYVLVKRFSSKEEKKRIVAVIYEAEEISSSLVGFENHLNYFHQKGRGLSYHFAKGLAAYLNSTLVDSYFRQFNGHTQVNATDLRNIHYPTRLQLEALGSKITDQGLSQSDLDKLIKKELLHMVEDDAVVVEPVNPNQVQQKIEEALDIIKALGFLRAQQNERSALTLLALLNIRPDTLWIQASNPLRGITPMMDFFREFYNKDYKPNTRETVRRQTVHQFLEAGLIEANPDQPDRPVNRPKAVYQIENGALELLRTFGATEWEQNLKTYLASIETLQKRYAKEREMHRIPVTLSTGKTVMLSPGGQNILVEKIIHDFASTYTPGGKVLYIGDTDEKFAHFDQEGLAELGVKLESHGKMPDVIIHYTEEDWLVLIEAVTSHGPIDGKRKDELERLFGHSRAGLVLVTAFLSRIAMLQYMKDIAWETDVWIAESPTHLIHFNGKRFLGPYNIEK